VLETTVRRLAVLGYEWPLGSVVVSVSPEAKFDPEIVSVYPLASATQVGHEALETLGVGAGGGATLKVVEPLLPLELSTTTLHVPAVPVGGMTW
jgi:hypothetical protein